jgi:pimeloyl-ACP methyl ester carboxylesterase
MRTTVAVLLALAALAWLPSAAAAADVPPGADWTQATIPSSDGVKLHADILRPKGSTAKTPVILSIGPYFNHSGQTGPAGPVEGTTYDPVGPSSGPSDRFLDFVEGAKLMQRGYAFVMVDLRGFGGSSGCLDWGGPGEQADVVHAIRWAATRSWSTGNVGMYGKSYDGVTGLIGANHHPEGLKAVVSQEPVYDLYRYLYGDGIRRENSLVTPALYDLIDLTAGPALDDPAYNAQGLDDTQRPGCPVLNLLDQGANDDHASAYWKARDLIAPARNSTVPLFLTQGLTENNTVADGTAQYLQAHGGYERAWLGPWEHVRGNETDENGRLKMGRKGFFDEVMRFYGRFLKGETPSVADPRVAVQTNDGRWRPEAKWPPADAKGLANSLNTGSYTDDGQGDATGDDAAGVWTISRPLPYPAHLSGSGTAVIDVATTLPDANLVVDVYDLDSRGTGPLITRQGFLARSGGAKTLRLWSADWKLATGHRIGVRVTDANGDWWIHQPSLQTVRVVRGSLTLPFLAGKRTTRIAGDPGVQLAGYLGETITVPAETLMSAERKGFTLPPAQG